MSMKRFVYLTVLISICMALYVPAAAADAPSVSAESALLYCPLTGEVLYEKNADAPMPMASTTKIMTALVVLENLPMDRYIEIDPAACGVEGSSLYMQGGEILRADDLLYALMLRSANDVALAFAYEICGSVDGFAQLMNEKAEELGLEHTRFANPHGLDHEYHYTTARELCRITEEAMKHPLFRRIVSSRSHRMPGPDGSVRVVVNHNKLLGMYDGSNGVKTGFTRKSGRCLVSSAEREGVELICVTLDAPSDWSDHRQLLDYGFSVRQRVLLAEGGQLIFEVPVMAGVREYVYCTNKSDIYAVLPDNSQVPTVRVECITPCAPIKKGDTVATVYFKVGSDTVASCELVAAQDIKEIGKKSFFDRLFNK